MDRYPLREPFLSYFVIDIFISGYTRLARYPFLLLKLARFVDSRTMKPAHEGSSEPSETSRTRARVIFYSHSFAIAFRVFAGGAACRDFARRDQRSMTRRGFSSGRPSDDEAGERGTGRGGEGRHHYCPALNLFVVYRRWAAKWYPILWCPHGVTSSEQRGEDIPHSTPPSALLPPPPLCERDTCCYITSPIVVAVQTSALRCAGKTNGRTDGPFRGFRKMNHGDHGEL